MPARPAVRIAAAAAAIVGLALATASVTYAATSASTPTVVKACASSKGVLSLLSAKGKCARGNRLVDINEKGRTGATGKTGQRGSKGATGTPAPTPVSIALDRSIDTGATPPTKSPTVAIGSTGVTISGTCQTGSSINFNELILTSRSEYYVHGSAQYLDSSGTAAFGETTQSNGGFQKLASGASLIYYADSGLSTIGESADFVSSASSENAQLYADLVVLAGGQSFSIHVYEYIAFGRCQISAQVITP